MVSVGVRDLRNRLSKLLARVRGGERLIVTDRGRPVAVVSPAPANGRDQRVEAMLRDGAMRWQGGKPRGLSSPPRIRGRQVSELVIQGRE